MPEINKFLQPIFINGEFRDEHLRNDFAETYNNIIKLEDEIRNFEKKISSSGEYGERYNLIFNDNSVSQPKRRRTQQLTERVQKESGSILERVQKALRGMTINLQSFLEKDPYVKDYINLKNLTKFAEKDDQFLPGLREAIRQFQLVLELLSEIESIEKK
jgi:hypothetical protein